MKTLATLSLAFFLGLTACSPSSSLTGPELEDFTEFSNDEVECDPAVDPNCSTERGGTMGSNG